MWFGVPTCPFLVNRTNGVCFRCCDCPILQNRTRGRRFGKVACPFLQNRTRGLWRWDECGLWGWDGSETGHEVGHEAGCDWDSVARTGSTRPDRSCDFGVRLRSAVTSNRFDNCSTSIAARPRKASLWKGFDPDRGPGHGTRTQFQTRARFTFPNPVRGIRPRRRFPDSPIS